jgi:hypothetical protein
MRRSVKLVVVMPVGLLSDKYPWEHLVDTLRSVNCYTSPSTQIILQTNGAYDLRSQVKAVFPDVVVNHSPQYPGQSGALYMSLSEAFLFAHRYFDFDVLLRLDIDALVTGMMPEDDAIEFFRRHPTVGQIGTYRTDSKGEVSDFSWPRSQLALETGVRGWLKDSLLRTTLRRLVDKAKVHGYELGEHVLGGAYFLSSTCIETLTRERLLANEHLGRSLLQEDHLFSLLVKASGMELGDFGTPHHPLAVQWKGLPDAPAALLAKGKKIIHSTRFWEEMDEEDVRNYFRVHREGLAQ